MAAVKKFTSAAARNQIRHIERQIENPSNPDIDRTKADLNYYLSPDRGITNYQYLGKLKDEVYIYGRNDVKILAGWIITQPEELPEKDSRRFFETCYDFLNETYIGGEAACVSCVVHADESGQRPHMHYLFVPLTENQKYKSPPPENESDTRKESERYEFKVCANDVLTRAHLSDFHPALQQAIDKVGLNCRVKTGIVRRQGGNRTVAEYKRERNLKRDIERNIERSRWQDDQHLERSHEKRVW